MARARRRAPSPELVDEEPQEMDVDQGATQPSGLDDPLTWKPGKQIPVTELLRRLKTLSEELSSIDQEEADRELLVPKAQELASPQLIAHKDKGVKAYALLCIVDMFRLLAPDAPYKSAQLKDIFTLFTSTVVPALAHPSDPYNQQHMMVLTSLTTIKSIVLLTDIPGSDNLILNLFTNCFDVMAGGARSVAGDKLPKNLEYHMTSMLCTLVDESAHLPNGVVDIILAQFLRADPNAVSATARKGDPKTSQFTLDVSPAYNMARAVCNLCGEKMSQAIGQYFSSVLVDASDLIATGKTGKPRGKKRTHDESEDESDDGLLTPPSEDDFREVDKAHRLLRELWRSSPDVITNVVTQVETELEAENTALRTMAVLTIGDMVAGIGAAGPLPPANLDPTAYPSQSLTEGNSTSQPQNPLLTPNAPHAFSSVYPSTYHRFIGRHKDKIAGVRAAWTTEAGRIILTSGGGKGLDDDQEKILLGHLARSLVDTDEKVRLAAVQAIAHFDFNSIVQKLGKSGSVATADSLLCNLGDRIKDAKHHVRVAAMELLARIWGVAAGAIAEGSERVHELLGAIPSRIFESWYTNQREIKALVQRVLYNSLLPTNYPPIKAKQTGEMHRIGDSQSATANAPDPDKIRAERILVLVRDLEDRAQPVFFSLLAKQQSSAKYVENYLQACEGFSGGDVKDGNAKETKKQLDRLIEGYAAAWECFSDPASAAEELKKFAKYHHRRSYQLIRFCYSPESDYRKVFKAMKELTKHMEDAPAAENMSTVLETLNPLVRSAAILVYNRSHVPAILDISRTDEKGLGAAAHEVLKQISSRAPHIFKAHVYELCETLKKDTPSAGAPADPAIVDTLKACAGFARRFPKDMPKERDFYRAMVAFAIHGNPPKATKHAVTVIVSSAERKEMYVKEIQKACITDFEYGSEGFLSKLAAISQLLLLANKECEDYNEAIMGVAIAQVLSHVRTVADDDDPEWSDQIDDDLSAKLWALRILVNGLRGLSAASEPGKPDESLKESASPVYKLLNTLISTDGELSKTGGTPRHHRAHLRLAAAIQLLKLSTVRRYDPLLTPNDFNSLARVAQDSVKEVRAGFVKALKKYLGASALMNRFYAYVFLYAFEPEKDVKEATVTWLKSRAAMSTKLNDHAMEVAFARFMSLLAHHQDFSTKVEDLEDFVTYILFYLKTAASKENLPMIYHITQRLKQVEDGIDPTKSENLYILSDIAEAVIRQFQDIHGWPLELSSSKVGLPSVIFQRLPSHEVAQEIVDKNYVPEELAEQLEDMVKNSMKTKTKKRKSDGSSTQAAKKHKPAVNATTKKVLARKAPRQAKTPKKRAKDSSPHSERRKSTRTPKAANYAEASTDDDELEQWQAEESEEERAESSTPPTSDPTPAQVLPAKDLGKKRKAAAGDQKENVTPPKASRKMPTRGCRATRQKKEKDAMDLPSDSE